MALPRRASVPDREPLANVGLARLLLLQARFIHDKGASGARFWAMLVCPRCHGRAQRLRLLDGQPTCVKCARASGLIYRSQSIRTEKRHVVTAPPRIALLGRDTPVRVNSRPNRVAERRVNAELALRRSLIVARKHGVDRAKEQGL